MALAIAFDDAQKNQIRYEADDRSRGITGKSVVTKFFDSRDHPDFPNANLNQWDAGRVSGAHFHVIDQFQVVIGGKGRLARHDLTPYCVHFARAYTPYGPVSSVEPGLRFFAVRARHDPGSHRLPQEKDLLKQVPGREPWQITRAVSLPAVRSGAATADTMLQAVPEIKDEHGLAAYTLSMKPGTRISAPDPSQGDGQYLMVLKGSVLYDDKELSAPALVFVYPKDGPLLIHAGRRGLDGFVLNFPRTTPRMTNRAKRGEPTTGLRTWRCALCGFAYDEAAGLPEEGIAPGTLWRDVPEIWSCPDCSATKADFLMVEVC